MDKSTRLLKTKRQEYSTARIGLPASTRRGGKAQFRTRTQGTPAQVGSIFPVKNPLTSGMSRPRISREKPFHGKPFVSQSPLTPLEKAAAEEEHALVAAGFKGWTIAVRYKDGTMENIPIVARDFQEALNKARPHMNQHPDQVDEIVIVDPSLGEVLHKIGSGAARVAKSIGKGVYKAAQFTGRTVKKVAKAGEEAAVKASRAIGRIEAIPATMKEAYEEAKAERPWQKKPGPIKKYLEPKPEVEAIEPEQEVPEAQTEKEWRGKPFEIEKEEDIAEKISRKLRERINQRIEVKRRR